MNYQFPNRTFVQKSRPHDYIYDNVYTNSSRKDFFKSVSSGARAGARLSVKPVFKSMFSDLKTAKRNEYCLTVPKPSPLENFLPQYGIAGAPVLPSDERQEYYRPLEPTGADRALYAVKYMPETFQLSRPEIQYDLAAEGRKAHKKKLTLGLTSISHGVQTDFRESSTQTDPYSPQYRLPYPGAYPKILALIKLTWGKGLPVTLEDIVVIERALAKRMHELGSHDIENQESFEKRVKLIEELEAQQWADREKELSNIMNQKLEIVNKLLGDSKTKLSNDNTLKLERTYELEKTRNTKVLAHVKHQYLRNMRKLEKQFFGPTKAYKRDVMNEYLNYDSQVYAPLVRNGRNLDQMYKAPEYKYRDYNNFALFDELTNRKSFKAEYLDFDVEDFSNSINSIQLVGKDKRMDRTLEEIFHAFRTETMRKSETDDAAMMKQMMMNTVRNMSTPVLEGQPGADDELIDHSIILLQQVIRGRAVQSMMRDEIRANMPTILNLKLLHKSDPYGVTTTWGEKARMASLQAERESQTESQSHVTEITDQLEGETLQKMLEFLDKEMVRLLDEKKVHTLLLIAERERRMKEAIEGGRRAHEEDVRRVNDEIFRQIVGLTQSTVDLYLMDHYLETMNRTSDECARDYVRQLAHALNEAAYQEMQASKESPAHEEMSAELVYGFMVPEINRVLQNERIARLSQRYKKVSGEVIEATINAQGWVKDALEDVWPTLTEHMEKGEYAVDGTKIAVDQFIQEAVETILSQKEHYDLIREDELQYKKEKEERAKARREAEEVEKVEEVLEVPSEEEEEEDEEEEEGGLPPGTSLRPCSPPPEGYEFYPAGSTLKREMAEISLQKAKGTEVQLDTLVLMDRTKTAADDLFDQVLEELLPLTSEDTEEQIEEILDDSDDY